MCVAGTISAGRLSLASLSEKAMIGGNEDAPFTEVLDALRGEDVVVPLPRELRLHETLGGEALHCLDNLEVRHIELFVLGGIVVLLGYKDALCTET